MIDRFILSGDLKPGASLTLLDALPERQYANLAAEINPLAQEAADRRRIEPMIVNLFRTLADYYVEDVVSNIDLEKITQDVEQQIRRAVWYAILYGQAPVVNIEGQPVAASPRGYWPVFRQSVRVGHALLIPYATQSHQGNMTQQSQIPDRVTILQITDGQTGTIQDAGYSGVSIAATGWRNIGGFSAMAVVNAGSCMFPAVTPIVEAFDVILKSAQNNIKRHGHPHLQAPASSIRYNEDGVPTINVSEDGSVFPVTSTDKDVKFISFDAPTGIFEFQAEQLLTQFAAMTGVPLETFNIVPLPRLERSPARTSSGPASNDRSTAILESVIRAFNLIGFPLEVIPETEPTGDPIGQSQNAGNAGTA